jgi:hypothetical protein
MGKVVHGGGNGNKQRVVAGCGRGTCGGFMVETWSCDVLEDVM